jgi:hypothetical protein
MIVDIKEKYASFHDAVINEVCYSYEPRAGLKGLKRLKVSMVCFNWQNEQWENVLMIFDEVTEFRYIDTAKLTSLVVFEALLKENEHGVVMDFFPLQVGQDTLEEDPNSTFVVHCKGVILSTVTSAGQI